MLSIFGSKAKQRQAEHEAELEATRNAEEQRNRAHKASDNEYQQCLDFLRGIFTSVKFPLLYYLTLQALYNRQAVRITPRLLHDEVEGMMNQYIYAKYQRHNTGDKALKVSWKALGITLRTLGVIGNRVRKGGRTRWYALNKDRVNKLVYLLGDDGMEGIIPYYDEYQARKHSSSYGDKHKEDAMRYQIGLFHSGWKGELGEYKSPFR